MPTQQVIVGQVTDEEIRASEEAMAEAKAKMMEEKDSGSKDKEDGM